MNFKETKMNGQLTKTKYYYRALAGFLLLLVALYSFLFAELSFTQLLTVYILITGADKLQDGLKTVSKINGDNK